MGSALSYIFRPLLVANPAERISATNWLKLGGYVGALAFVANTDFFKSPDDLINCFHKTGLFLQNLGNGSNFNQATQIFSTTAYNQRAKENRDSASLYGHRDWLRPTVAGLMIALGVGQTAIEMGRWFQTPPPGTAQYASFVEKYGARMPNARLARGLGFLFVLYTGARLLADCWGNARGRESIAGTCASNPKNFDLHDFNLNIFSSEWAMMAFLSTAHGRAATLAGNATDVLYHKIGNLVHRTWLKPLLGSDFFPTTSFTTVRAEAIAIPAEVKSALMAGSLKGPLAWKIGYAALALGAIGYGLWSVTKVAKKESCNPYGNLVLSAIGGTVLCAGIAMLRSPSWGKGFESMTHISKHIFRAPRLAHMLLFSLVGGTTTTSINFVLRFIQGFRNMDYYVQNGLRSLYGPLPNRVFGNAWSSFRPDPLGRIEFVLPGQILFYQTVEVLTQPKETLSQSYQELAQQYRFEGDPVDVENDRAKLVQKESDLAGVLTKKQISVAELAAYYQQSKKDKANHSEGYKQLPIHKTVSSDSLAEQYINILGIRDDFGLTQDELH